MLFSTREPPATKSQGPTILAFHRVRVAMANPKPPPPRAPNPNLSLVHGQLHWLQRDEVPPSQRFFLPVTSVPREYHLIELERARGAYAHYMGAPARFVRAQPTLDNGLRMWFVMGRVFDATTRERHCVWWCCDLHELLQGTLSDGTCCIMRCHILSWASMYEHVCDARLVPAKHAENIMCVMASCW